MNRVEYAIIHKHVATKNIRSYTRKKLEYWFWNLDTQANENLDKMQMLSNHAQRPIIIIELPIAME